MTSQVRQRAVFWQTKTFSLQPSFENTLVSLPPCQFIALATWNWCSLQFKSKLWSHTVQIAPVFSLCRPPEISGNPTPWLNIHCSPWAYLQSRGQTNGFTVICLIGLYDSKLEENHNMKGCTLFPLSRVVIWMSIIPIPVFVQTWMELHSTFGMFCNCVI